MLNLTKQVKVFEWDDNRIGKFDYIRGLFMIGMILQHSSLTFIRTSFQDPSHSKLITLLMLLLNYGVNAFQPLLMIVCGYEYRKKKSMRAAVRNQVKYLWKPYLIVTLIMAVMVFVNTLLMHGNVLEQMNLKVLPFLFGNLEARDYFGIDMFGVGPMWFWFVYVVSGIMLNAVLQIEDTTMQWLMILLIFSIGTVGTVGPITVVANLPFGIYRSLTYVLYMFIGWQMKKHRFFERRFPLWAIIVFGLVTLGMIYNRRDDALACLFFSFSVLMLLPLLEKTKIGSVEWLRWLGRHITFFCCIHTVIFRAFPWEAIEPYFPESTIGGVAVHIAIYSATCIGGCILADHIQHKRFMKKTQKAIEGN